MLLDYIRQINAGKKFSLDDSFEFVEFDDITQEEITETSVALDAVEIWASVKIPFKGALPDSYRVLNYMIADWVEKNEDDLTKVIHEKLVEHFKESYPDSDPSELISTEESVIWSDQLDFMPRANEEENFIVIEIELVVETEEIEE